MCAQVELAAQTVSNVNGVRTVIYAPNAKPKGNWSINPTPLQRVTSDNGVDLLEVGGIVRFADGSLLTMSRQSSTLHLFAPDGRHVRDIGRKGKGPGEFADNGLALFRIRDTVLVSDGTGTAQVFAPDGKYLRTQARPKGGSKGEQIWRVGYFADGRAILQTYPGRDTMPPARKMLHSSLFAERNDVRTEIGRFPFQQRLSMAKGPGYAEVFGPYGSVTVLRSGYCTAFAEVFALDCFSADGKQLSRVERRDVRGIPVTAADKEAYFADMARANPTQPAYVSEVRANAKFAERMPAFGRLIASSNDEIWIEPSLPADRDKTVDASPATATTWCVFAPNGDWLSNVTLPKRFRLMEVGANYVAGVYRDSDDVEEIVVYPLVKR